MNIKIYIIKLLKSNYKYTRVAHCGLTFSVCEDNNTSIENVYIIKKKAM